MNKLKMFEICFSIAICLVFIINWAIERNVK